jgi:hypothetical protein
MKRTMLLIGGILGVLIGLGFVFPAIALWRNSGALPGMSVALLLLGIALTLGGGIAAICGFRKRAMRWL